MILKLIRNILHPVMGLVVKFNLSLSKSKWYASDVVIVSYPKSGVSYLSFLLANIYELSINKRARLKINYYNVDEYVADLHSPTFRRETGISPRLIKSHDNAHQYRKRVSYFSESTYCRIIFLERDVEDSLYSYFLYHNAVRKGSPLDVNAFLRYLEKRGRAQPFWNDSWSAYRSQVKKGFVTVRYEDLLEDPGNVLRELCDFIGWDVEDNVIESAISNSGRDALKELEELQGDGMVYSADYSFSTQAAGRDIPDQKLIRDEIASWLNRA